MDVVNIKCAGSRVKGVLRKSKSIRDDWSVLSQVEEQAGSRCIESPKFCVGDTSLPRRFSQNSVKQCATGFEVHNNTFQTKSMHITENDLAHL